MGHAHVDLVDAACRRSLDQLVEHRDNGLAALKRKALLAEIFFVQKLLELFRLDQLLQQLLFGLDSQRLSIDELLADLLPDPGFLLVALNMAVFDTDLAAIGFAKNLEDTAKRGGFLAVQAAGNKFAVEVPNRQAKILEIQLGRVDARSCSADRCPRAGDRERDMR